MRLRTRLLLSYIVVIAVTLPLYWLAEGGRQEGAVEDFRQTFVRRGDVSRWLTSEAFDLKEARSLEAEHAIVEALALVRKGVALCAAQGRGGRGKGEPAGLGNIAGHLRLRSLLLLLLSKPARNRFV